MQVSQERARINRSKRRDELLGLLTRLIGGGSVVVLVASVFYVVVQKMMEPQPVDEAYLESVYGDDAGRMTWSGKKDQAPDLMSSRGFTPPPVVGQDGDNATASGRQESGVSASLARPGPTPEEPAVPRALPAVNGIGNLEAKRGLIEQAVKGFFEAITVEDKLAFVRDPERVRSLMIDYYNRQPASQARWKALGWTLTVDEPGYRFGYVQAILEEGSPVSLIIEEMENGSFRVDWESSVRYGELSWQDFLRMKPLQPKLFRVIASKSEGTPGPSATSEQEVLEIKHPAEAGVVYASFDRRDPGLAPMVQQLQVGKWKDVPLTLRLCYPGPAADHRSVRIAGVEGKGWLILQHTRS